MAHGNVAVPSLFQSLLFRDILEKNPYRLQLRLGNCLLGLDSPKKEKCEK